MKVINHDSPLLAVQLAEQGSGWEVLTPPGTLSPLLVRWFGLSMETTLSWRNGRQWEVIPLTTERDQAIVELVDALIELRYATSQVQLPLFSLEDL